MGETNGAQYLAEFVGTFMLVFAVGCNVLTQQAVWGVTSIACTLMVCIYALGGISGANFNPAVSFALGCCKKMEWGEVGKYMGAQFAGGIAGSALYGLVFFKVFNLAPAPGYTFTQVILAELLYTMMLCFVVLNVAASKMHAGANQFYGLAIGFVVVAGGYGAGHISGGCFNPAVAVGIDVSSAALGFGWCIAYTACELVGAVFAACLFKVCRPEEAEGNTDLAPAAGGYALNSRLLSEFLGTFMLVLTVGLNVLGSSPAPVLSIAASLMCMIFALGSCSGAHFNPAVTLAIVCSNRNLISVSDASLYVVVQLAGGACAALAYGKMEAKQGELYSSFPLQPQRGHGWLEVGFLETSFTFLLAFVVLSVATVKDPLSEYFGLAIGACVIAGGNAIGAVSGGSLNPAVSFGISTCHYLDGGNGLNWIVYSMFELFGGALAAAVFMGTRPSEYSKAGDCKTTDGADGGELDGADPEAANSEAVNEERELVDAKKAEEERIAKEAQEVAAAAKKAEEEALAKQRADEASKKTEQEAAAKRAAEEAEAAKKTEEEAMKKAKEDAAAKAAQRAEAAKKLEEDKERARKAEEDELSARREAEEAAEEAAKKEAEAAVQARIDAGDPDDTGKRLSCAVPEGHVSRLAQKTGDAPKPAGNTLQVPKAGGDQKKNTKAKK